MPNKVLIEEHLDNYLKSLVKGQSYVPGVIIGQVIDGDYYVVHLSAITVWEGKSKNYETNILSYSSLHDLMDDSDTIFEKSLDVVNLLPGGSYVIGLFFIIPHDIKSVQPLNLDFNKYQRLNDHLSCKKYNRSWNYLLLNYSTVNKKSYCFTVDYSRSMSSETATFKSIDTVIKPVDDDWVTLIGTFNFGTLNWLNVAGGPKALSSIRDNLLDELDSILNQSVYTFNGYVCDENKVLKDFEYDTIGDSLKNVINVELYREVDSGNECKNASLRVVRGKGKILMSGLCSLAVPFNRNGKIKDAVQAIHEDAMQTFATRLKMHLDSFVEEESIDDEEGDVNVVHETPRRVLILKTEGSKFAFSDYVFPGEDPQEALYSAGDILNLPVDKIELYDMLEKGRHSNYETLPDIDNTSSPLQNASTVKSNNNMLIYFTWAALIMAVLAYVIKQIFF